jgi:hypothetical protein
MRDLLFKFCACPNIVVDCGHFRPIEARSFQCEISTVVEVFVRTDMVVPPKMNSSRAGWDSRSGMLYSDVAAFFIILATGVTLYLAGITDIQTATRARAPSRPAA